jgi:hypothetical protein
VLIRPGFIPREGEIKGKAVSEGPIHRGIFMASTLEGSCAVYPVNLDPSVIGAEGLGIT